jgi:hypothetical protein
MASRARVSRRMLDSPTLMRGLGTGVAASSAKGLGRPRPKFAVAQLAHKANTQTVPAFLVACVAAGPPQGSPTIPPNSPICQRTDQVRLQ